MVISGACVDFLSLCYQAAGACYQNIQQGNSPLLVQQGTARSSDSFFGLQRKSNFVFHSSIGNVFSVDCLSFNKTFGVTLPNPLSHKCFEPGASDAKAKKQATNDLAISGQI